MMRGLRISIAGLMAVVLATSAAIACLMFASELVAGVVLLPTLAVLVIAILGSIYRTGERRASWLGFALFGWGYMVLASGSWWDRDVKRPELATTALLDQFYPLLQRDRNPRLMPTGLGRLFDDPDPKNRAIFAKLAEPFSMNFPNPTPLDDVKKYIEQASQDVKIGLPTGIPMYIEGSDAKDSNKLMGSTVEISVEGVPLRTTLTLILRQLGLTFDVRDGLLRISRGSSGADGIESFRRVGHCFLALVIATSGGMIGRRFARSRPGLVAPAG